MKPMRKEAIILVLILAISVLQTAFYVNRVSATVSIDEMTPAEGFVGTEVALSGQINTANGSYEILFDGEIVKNGTADVTTASEAFIVPNSTVGLHNVQLRDVSNDTESAIWSFTVQTQYSIIALIPSEPRQLQEGANVTISATITGEEENMTTHGVIQVEDPANHTFTSDEFLIQTDLSGYWTIQRNFPSDFNGGNYSTFFVGDYEISLVQSSNETLATESFIVGLTNSTEYHRFETINIRSLNYTMSEVFNIEITYEDEIVFQSRPNATGIVEEFWKIPSNVSLGLYEVEVSWKPFEKPVLDIQNFNVTTKYYACEVRAINLEGELVTGVLVEAENLTVIEYIVDDEITDENGTASFLLESADYNFVASWNLSEPQTMQIGEVSDISLSGNLTGGSAINITCSLTHITVNVIDEQTMPLPLVEVRMNFSYISIVGGKDVPINGSITYETDVNGTIRFQNVFININYSFEASRHQILFNTTTAINVTSRFWLNITCPAYWLVLNVYNRDGVDSPLQEVVVKVYDWDLGKNAPEGSYAKRDVTDSNGNVKFYLAVGRYGILVYVDDMLLNETEANLYANDTTYNITCILYPLTLTVEVLDYFGQAISNVNVTIERYGVPLTSSNTGGGGIAQFSNLIGGNFKAYAYVGGIPYGTATVYLDEPQTVTIQIKKMVSLGGLLIETSQFVIIILAIILILAFLISYIYRRYRKVELEE
jgi:hypothetical protein